MNPDFSIRNCTVLETGITVLEVIVVVALEAAILEANIITNGLNQIIGLIFYDIVCYAAVIEENVPAILKTYHIEFSAVMHIAVLKCHISCVVETYQTIRALVDLRIIHIDSVRVCALKSIGTAAIQPAVIDIYLA